MPTVWNGNRWVVTGGRTLRSTPAGRRQYNAPWNRVRARHNWKVAIAVARGQAKRKIAFYRHARSTQGLYRKYRQRYGRMGHRYTGF